MRMNRSTGHALRIMLACAARERRLSKVAELADELSLTLQNTFKMIHLLSQSGLITATRGRNGGVMLARPAAEISIGEIVRAIETIALEGDGDSGGTHRQRFAPAVASVLDDALLAFIAVLEKHTLAEIATLASSDRLRFAGDRPKSRKTAAARRPSAPAPARSPV